MDFQAAMEAFFVSRAPKKDSPHTVAAYRRDLDAVGRHAAEVVGIGVEQLQCIDLEAKVLRVAFARFAQSRAKSSIARAWSVWNAFFGFLVGEQIVAGNPMSAVAKPRPVNGSPKPLKGEDAAERLLTAVASGARGGRHPWPQRDVAVLAVLLLTGVRSSELLGLTVGDVAGPVGERRLRVRGGKGDADRVLPVEPELELLLEDYAFSREVRLGCGGRSGDPLFVDHRGVVLSRNQLQYLVRQCYRVAGVSDQVERGALVHALRHTFATRLGQSGASAVEVMELLGHRSLQSSQGYIKATARELREAARANSVYVSLRRLRSRGEDVGETVDDLFGGDDER